MQRANNSKFCGNDGALPSIHRKKRSFLDEKTLLFFKDISQTFKFRIITADHIRLLYD